MGPNLFREKRYDALLEEECTAAKMPSILRSKSTSGFKSVKLAEHVVVHDKGGVTTTEKMKLPPRVTVNVESLDLFKSLALKSPSFNNKRTLLGNGGSRSGDDYNDDHDDYNDDDGPITTNSLRSPRSPSSTMELPSLPLPTSSSSSLSRIQSICGNNDRQASLSTVSSSSRGVDSSRRSSFSDLQTSDEQSRQSKTAAARSPRRSSDSQQQQQQHHQHQSTPRPPTFYAPPPLHNNSNNTSSTATTNTSLILASPSPSRRRARSSLIRDAPSIADLYAATTEPVRTNFTSSSPAQHSRQRRFVSSQSRQMLSNSNNLDSSIEHSSASTKDLFNTNNSRRSSTLGDTDDTDDFIIPNKTANLKRHESLDTIGTLEDEIMIRKEEEEQVSNHSLSSFLGRADNANNDELYSSNASSSNNKDASSVFDASIVDSIALTKFKNKRGTSWASLSTPPCVFDSTAAETKEKSRRRSRSSKPPRSSSRRSSRSVGSSKSSSSRSVASAKSSSSRSVASSDKDESRRSRRSSEKKRSSSSSKKSGTERSRSSSRRRSSSRKRDEASSSSRRRSVERISN